MTTPTAIVWSGLFVAPLGRSRLAEFRKPAAEGVMPSGALLARVGKLGSHIGKLGSERGDYQLVMIDDRLAICGRSGVALVLMECAADIRRSPRGQGYRARVFR